MTSTHAERIQITRSSAIVSADKRFGRYKTEERQGVRQVEVKEDLVLRQLKEAWRKFKYDETVDEVETLFAKACKLLKGINLSSKDVENFSIALAEFQDEKNFDYRAGTFLSAMIRKGSDEDYLIHVFHLSVKINLLGFYNTKRLTVKGDIGDMVGAGMKKGKIIIKGNAEDAIGIGMKNGVIIIEGNAGDVGEGMEDGTIIIEGNAERIGEEMSGGNILVKGNASHDTGKLMRGGKIIIEGDTGYLIGLKMVGGFIHIKGNVREFVGSLMQGGEIHLEGDFVSLGDIKGGKIFHKGKLIYPKKLSDDQ